MAEMIDCPKCGGTGKIRDNGKLAAEMVKLRETKVLTLTEVAKEMSLSKAYISDLEHGRRTWSVTLEKRYLDAISLLSKKGALNV